MRKNGQIAVEYLLAMAVVVLALIIFIVPGGDMDDALTNVIEMQGEENIFTVGPLILSATFFVSLSVSLPR